VRVADHTEQAEPANAKTPAKPGLSGASRESSKESPLPCPATSESTRRPPLARPSSSRWLVYLLRCSDGSLYTGITNDLPKRLKAHATGKASRYTRSRLPVRLVYQEPQAGRSSALKREAAIKRLSRPQKDKLVAKR